MLSSLKICNPTTLLPRFLSPLPSSQSTTTPLPLPHTSAFDTITPVPPQKRTPMGEENPQTNGSTENVSPRIHAANGQWCLNPVPNRGLKRQHPPIMSHLDIPTARKPQLVPTRHEVVFFSAPSSPHLTSHRSLYC